VLLATWRILLRMRIAVDSTESTRQMRVIMPYRSDVMSASASDDKRGTLEPLLTDEAVVTSSCRQLQLTLSVKVVSPSDYCCAVRVSARAAMLVSSV